MLRDFTYDWLVVGGFCRQVIWLSDVDKTKGYAVDFLSLSLHAVSRDPEAYTSPCIYTQVGNAQLPILSKFLHQIVSLYISDNCSYLFIDRD